MNTVSSPSNPSTAARDAAHTSPAAAMDARSRFALRLLFWLACHTPWLLRALKPLAVLACATLSRPVREATESNATCIFGAGVSDARRQQFTRNVIGNFYDFVSDVGRSSDMSATELRAMVAAVEGRDAYVARRKEFRGVIFVTAHMGSFEIGLAALTEAEPKIHVVYKRDNLDGFETLRHALRVRLAVHEAAIDDGWTTWMGLRDALQRDEVVVMQGDRAMPGQRSQIVPLLHGRVALPLGPIRLAQISGSPIVPVFAVRESSGPCRLFVEPPIRVDPDAPTVGGIDPALLRVGKAIEKFVARYPEQWLVLEPAFVEPCVNPAGSLPSA